MPESWTSPSVVAAFSSALAAAFSAWIAWRAFLMMRSEQSPQIIVRVVHDKLRTPILMIVIENVGKAVAFGVGFDLSRSIPEHAWGSEVKDPQLGRSKRMTAGPLISGIAALAPGETRELTWGNFDALKAELGDQPVQCNATYKDINDRRYGSVSILEILSFAGTDASQKDPLQKMSSSLEQISADLGQLVNRDDHIR